MEVKINKEIGDYREQIFFGFTARQCLTAVIIAIIAIVVGIRCMNLGAGMHVATILIVLICGPIAVLGFYTHNGMSAWQLIVAFVRCTVLMPAHLVYKADNYYYDLFRSYKKEVRPRVKRDRTLRKARNMHPADDTITVDVSSISAEEQVPRNIDEIMDEISEEEKEKQKERILRKELRKKKAVRMAKRLGSLLVDIVIWVIISLLITYLVNKTDVLNIIGKWIQRIFNQ